MRIRLNTAPGAKIRNLSGKNFLDDRIGFWGDVVAVNSRNNSVDVIADIGLTYRNIPVASHEWVCAKDDKGYVSAERNLPPIGSRVFVLTPTQSVTGGFVLCSGFAKGETKTHALYAANDGEKDAKNNESEKVTQGGWNEKEDFSNGNRKTLSADENIKIELNPSENSQKSQGKEVSLVAWGNEIHISENGIEIKVPDGNAKVTVKGDCTLSTDGDCKVDSKNEINLTSTGNVEIKVGSSGTVKIGQETATLGSLVSQFMAAFQTAFVTGQVVINPEFLTKVGVLKQQWDAVFK